jgi:hypothetical protein
MVHASLQLGVGSGLVLGVPIPAHMAAEAEPIQAAIEQSLADAARRGIAGREVGAPAALAGPLCSNARSGSRSGRLSQQLPPCVYSVVTSGARPKPAAAAAAAAQRASPLGEGQAGDTDPC